MKITEAALHYHPETDDEPELMRLEVSAKLEAPIKLQLHDTQAAEFDHVEYAIESDDMRPRLSFSGWSLTAKGERDKRETYRTWRVSSRDISERTTRGMTDWAERFRPQATLEIIERHPQVKILIAAIRDHHMTLLGFRW